MPTSSEKLKQLIRVLRTFRSITGTTPELDAKFSKVVQKILAEECGKILNEVLWEVGGKFIEETRNDSVLFIIGSHLSTVTSAENRLLAIMTQVVMDIIEEPTNV